MSQGAPRTDSRANNFDLLRIFAALLVLLSHSWPLSGLQGEPLSTLVPFTTLGGLGVRIFFVISGYLVFASWERDPNIGRFLARRALRIFPGLVVLVLLTVFVLGPLLTNLSLGPYLLDQGTWNYLNVMLLYPMVFALPGVFASNPYPNAVNGSLWTLPVEFSLYLALALGVGRACVRSRSTSVILAMTLLVASEVAWRSLPQPFMIFLLDLRYLLDFGAYFAIGTVLYQFRGILRPHGGVALLLGLLFLAFAKSPWGRVALYLTFPYIVLTAAYLPLPSLSRVGRFGDASYGAYIYAFPIQQVVAQFLLGKIPWFLLVALQGVLAVLAGYASWHLVEKKGLALKPQAPPPVS